MRFFSLSFVALIGCSAPSPSNNNVDVGKTSGWLVGLGGTVAATIDGSNFFARSFSAGVDLYSVVCVGDELGWAVGDGGAVYHTENGGIDWVAQTSNTDANLRQIAFADKTHGLAVGELGTIIRTTDAGKNWVLTPAAGKERPSAATANVVTASGTRWFVASENGGLFRSVDDGATFQVLRGIPNGVFRAIRFAPDHALGFAVGDSGVVIRTRDGGDSWSALASAPSNLVSVAIDPTSKVIMATGENGLVWRSLDGGDHFTAADLGTTQVRLNGAAFRQDSSEGWVVGEKGTIFYTPDGAQTFRAATSPTTVTLTAIEGL